LDREVHAAVGDDNVTALAEGRDDGRDGREALGIEDGCLCAEEVCDVTFESEVDIYKNVINLSFVLVCGPDYVPRVP
jgi:hypothetical protein